MEIIRKVSLYCLFLSLIVTMSDEVFALDLSIDSFSTPQAAQASSQRSVAKSNTSATAIGSHRELSVLNTSKKGTIDVTVAARELKTYFSDGAAGRVTVVWDGDGKPGLSTSSALNTKISIPLCDALVIGIKSFSREANDVRIQARLYNPFADGSQFLAGTLVLSRSTQGTTLELPISAMRAGGTGALDRDFPLGAIVLTIDGPLTLSSVSLRCPPKAFVNLEKSDYEMNLVGEPSPQHVLSTASTQMNSGASARSPTQGTKQPTPYLTPTQTPQPAAVCGNGIIEVGEECDSGTAILNPACENCKVVCPKATSGDSRLKTATTQSECSPPPICGAPYKTCSSTSKHGGSQCCYDPETEDCVTFKSYGHPIAKCAPKKGSCKEPNAKECKSGKGDRACCPSDSTSKCAQGGGLAICSFSACGPNQTPCTTATGLVSEATLCCSNETEECTDTIEILGNRIKACAAKPADCVNAGGTVCMGNGTPRCCRPGTVCSPSVDGLANCVKRERTIPEPADATL